MNKTQRQSRDRMIAQLWMGGRSYSHLGKKLGVSNSVIKRALETYLTPEERAARIGNYKSGAKPKHDPEKVFDFILRHKAENDGLSPTLQEIGDACGISSKSVVCNILENLALSGRIQISSERSRGIRVLGARWVPPAAGN